MKAGNVLKIGWHIKEAYYLILFSRPIISILYAIMQMNIFLVFYLQSLFSSYTSSAMNCIAINVISCF